MGIFTGTVPSFLAGELPDADKFTSMTDFETAALARCGVRARRVAVQSVPSVTSTLISFDTEDEDTNGFFAPTSNTFTIPAGGDGLYALGAQTVQPAVASTRNIVEFQLTSAVVGTPPRIRNNWTSAEDNGSVSGFVKLAAGDLVKLAIFHSMAGAQNFTAWIQIWKLSL